MSSKSHTHLLLFNQDEESEFDHFQDDEEFEGYDSERASKVDEKEAPKITITKVSYLTFKIFLLMTNCNL